MDHLEEARKFVNCASTGNLKLGTVNAQVAVAHALIAIAERLTPPETWSARSKRLKEEEQDEL